MSQSAGQLRRGDRVRFRPDGPAGRLGLVQGVVVMAAAKWAEALRGRLDWFAGDPGELICAAIEANGSWPVLPLVEVGPCPRLPAGAQFPCHESFFEVVAGPAPAPVN